MSAAAEAVRPWSVTEFLAWERQQPDRHEFIGGRIYAMAPARVDHARQANRLARSLNEQVRAPCEVFTEGPQLVAAGEAFIPDVWVTCDGPDGSATELHDAELVIEVLSPSNRPGEMTAKLEAYLTLPSLVAYLVVNDKTYDAWTRVGEGGPWQCSTVKAGAFTVMLHGREVKL